MSNSSGAKAHSLGECLMISRGKTSSAKVVTNPTRINVRRWKRFASTPAGEHIKMPRVAAVKDHTGLDGAVAGHKLKIGGNHERRSPSA
jgi:hypothetical protein